MRRAEAWTRDSAYESFMGRWSRRLAPRFLDLLPPAADGALWCDVGCGTGALAHAVLAGHRPGRVVGVDPSAGYLAAARRGGASVVAGSAAALPLRSGACDRVVSALVLNFVPDPAAALAEMRRVARPGAVVAACVWDYADGMGFLRAFWDAAAALSPDAAAQDEGARFVLCRPEPLRALLTGAGLRDVLVEPVEIPTVFAGFDDLWTPFLGGQGPAAGHVAALPPARRDALREHLRAALPPGPDGTITLTARAWAAWGRT